MNWEPVITAWIIFLGIAILGIIAIQTADVSKPFRRMARFMLIVMILAFDLFAVIAEFYHINFFWAILFAPGVCMFVLLIFFFSWRKGQEKVKKE